MPNSYNKRKVDSFGELLMVIKCALKCSSNLCSVQQFFTFKIYSNMLVRHIRMVQLNLNLTKHTCAMYSNNATQHVYHFARVYPCVYKQD